MNDKEVQKSCATNPCRWRSCALWLVLLLMVVLLVLEWKSFLWSGVKEGNRFGKVLSVYSFAPEVSATVYNSKHGDATVIWVSGMDDPGNIYGKVWNAYSFNSKVSVSVYDSVNAGATVIWLSGMDYMPDPPKAKKTN